MANTCSASWMDIARGSYVRVSLVAVRRRGGSRFRRPWEASRRLVYASVRGCRSPRVRRAFPRSSRRLPFLPSFPLSLSLSLSLCSASAAIIEGKKKRGGGNAPFHLGGSTASAYSRGVFMLGYHREASRGVACSGSSTNLRTEIITLVEGPWRIALAANIALHSEYFNMQHRSSCAKPHARPHARPCVYVCAMNVSRWMLRSSLRTCRAVFSHTRREKPASSSIPSRYPLRGSFLSAMRFRTRVFPRAWIFQSRSALIYRAKYVFRGTDRPPVDIPMIDMLPWSEGFKVTGLPECQSRLNCEVAFRALIRQWQRDVDQNCEIELFSVISLKKSANDRRWKRSRKNPPRVAHGESLVTARIPSIAINRAWICNEASIGCARNTCFVNASVSLIVIRFRVIPPRRTFPVNTHGECNAGLRTSDTRDMQLAFTPQIESNKIMRDDVRALPANAAVTDVDIRNRREKEEKEIPNDRRFMLLDALSLRHDCAHSRQSSREYFNIASIYVAKSTLRFDFRADRYAAILLDVWYGIAISDSRDFLDNEFSGRIIFMFNGRTKFSARILNGTFDASFYTDMLPIDHGSLIDHVTALSSFRNTMYSVVITPYPHSVIAKELCFCDYVSRVTFYLNLIVVRKGIPTAHIKERLVLPRLWKRFRHGNSCLFIFLV